MIPANFEEANTIFGPPEGMTEDDVKSIRAYVGEHLDSSAVTITCWKPTREELDSIEKTGRVWLMIFGKGMPPVAVTGWSPFKPADLIK